MSIHTTTIPKKTVRFQDEPVIIPEVMPTTASPRPSMTSLLRASLGGNSHHSTWQSQDEMLGPYEYDLSKANLFESGCLRGLEFHMNRNYHRVEYSRAFVKEVVARYWELRRSGNEKVNVEEGTRRFAAQFSRDCRVFARRVAEQDEQDARQIQNKLEQKSTPGKLSSSFGPVCVGKSLHFTLANRHSSARYSPAAISA
jgi:hypothetical protein